MASDAPPPPQGNATAALPSRSGVAVAGVVGVLALALAVSLAFPSLRANAGAGYLLAGAAVIALVVVAAGALSERRRIARFLDRLQHALAGVSPAPDLQRTLSSIALTARTAADAKFVSVLVRDADGVVQGALEGDHAPDPRARSTEIIDRILAAPERSPSGVVLTTGEPVVVPDVRSDRRFAHWADEASRQGFTSTIAVPLKSAAGITGVLAAYLRSPAQVTPETVRLLTAYGEHAALVVQRALAWEHERAAAQRLEEADRLKSDLVATVSHELRTPLTSVHGFAETLVRHWDRFEDAERRHFVERVLHNSIELARLIDQVLDYSKLEAGVVSIDPEPVAVDDLVTGWAERHQHLMGDHELVIAAADDVVVHADVEAADHVLTNLVSNAVKYSPTGTTVWLRAGRDGGTAVISVVDEGPGIPAHDHERIFERFERGSYARGSIAGSGIGLAVVRRYVELLGGTVWVESDVGDGATFSFTLPLAETTAATTPETLDRPEADLRATSKAGRPGAR